MKVEEDGSVRHGEEENLKKATCGEEKKEIQMKDLRTLGEHLHRTGDGRRVRKRTDLTIKHSFDSTRNRVQYSELLMHVDPVHMYF